MNNNGINNDTGHTQAADGGLNLVGPTISYLDIEILRDNQKFAKQFERLNAGAVE